MDRVVGPTYIYQDKMYWLFEKPWFELTDEGEFIEMGKFSDRPWSWFFELFNQTYFFKSFGISFPSQYGPRHYNFLAKMMKAVEIESNKQAPQSKFTVVLYPNWSKKRRDLIVKSFKEQGVDYLDLSQVPIAQFTDHMAGIPLDSHPTACENNILAQILVKELELK
ncbi:MAG: hypothetical protein HRT44_03340 [Bdellovibrionales bacterium]|nr:hypothetical protein [Bdellovibrionales bacterium]NQZ18281.1 hypothetical protein [Bdellovibrionales bacterium]